MSKHYGYNCAVCGDAIKEPQPTAHTDEGLAHTKCCQEHCADIPTAIWSCSVCKWVGLDLSIGEAPEYHHRWNSKQGMRCPGNLSPNVRLTDRGD